MAKSLKFTTFPPNASENIHNKQNEENIIPIVLLHGWGLNSGVWQTLIALFNDDKQSNYQLITLDLPGFGSNSAVGISPYSLSNICHHIDQVIEQPAIYLGWSLGGLVATEMALKYPEKVCALITVASSPYFVENTSENWPGIKENVLNNFHNQLAEDTKKTINGFLKIQAMGSPHIRPDLKLITQLVMEHPLPSQKTLDESLALLSSCDLRQVLAEIKQPFLRLYGNNDSLVPKAVIERVNILSKNSDHHLFDKASHAPFISHLNDFYQVLSNWLDSYTSQGVN